MDQEIVDSLQNVGLTEYQARAYVATVSLGTARFSALADEADIPQQRIYDVVDDLRDLGLVEVHEGGNGKQAVAVPPDAGLADLKRARLEEFESTFDTAIGGLNQLFAEVDTSAGFVTVVNHESSARRHVANAVASASWWLFLSLPVAWYDDVEDAVRDAVDRDVTVRALVQSEDRTVVENHPFPDGVTVRHRPSADVVIAADREYGVFRGVAAPAVTRPALVTRDESMVEMFQRYSEQFWAASRRIRSDDGYPRRYLSPWRAITDHREQLDAGEPFEVYVEGHDTETGRQGSWTGRIVEFDLDAERDADYAVVLPEVARLVVETDDGRITVGGWDATLEDVAAHGLEIRRPG